MEPGDDTDETSDVRVEPVGSGALLVVLGTEQDEAVRGRVRGLDEALTAEPVPGQVEVVPALVDLLVVFDPLVTDHAAVAGVVRRRLRTAARPPRTAREHRVQVCYHERLAPDLAAVAEAVGLSTEAVVAAHLAGDYDVAMYGFVPGYAYLDGLDASIEVPRKEAAVPGVPAGSVIVARSQTIVTSVTLPTGWSVLGRSPTRVLRPDDDEPFLFDVGDRVTFERIDLATFERLGTGT